MVFHSWFSIGIASIGWLLKSQELIFVYLSIIAIAISDIFAYEIGKRFGSRKLAENISPNKTVEGFLAGLLIGTLFMSFNIAINLDKSYLSSFLVSILFL